MMIIPEILSVATVCFTGPRPKNLHGYERQHYQAIVDYTEAVCRELVNAGTVTFISGGAQGFDQLAFWAVDRIRRTRPEINNIVYVPFRRQPSRWAEKGLFSQGEYRLMLRRATQVHIITEADPETTGDAVKALHHRNHAMVSNADLVVALLTDRSLQWETSKGGTAECVRYAYHNARKPILAIQYRPQTAQPLEQLFLGSDIQESLW